MEYVRLGTAGVQVSQICLGTNMLGGYVDEKASIEVVRSFMDAGGNFIDLSDTYNEGKSEEAVGKAVKGRRDEVVLGSKVSGTTGPGPNDRWASRKHVMSSVEGSLRRLGTDYLDLYTIHFWNPDVPLEESLRAFDDLVRQGKVRYVGVSNFSGWQVMKALWTADKMGLDPIRAVQTEFSLLKREPEAELFPVCVDQNLISTPYWVLQAGLFTGRYQQGKEAPADSRFANRPGLAQRFGKDEAYSAVEHVVALAGESGHTPTEVSIAWALSKPSVGSVIIGSSKPEQVKANLAAVDVRLDNEVLDALDSITAVPAVVRTTP